MANMMRSLRKQYPDCHVAVVFDAAQEFFSDLPPLRFNSLALFAQPAPGTDFVLLDHLEMAR